MYRCRVYAALIVIRARQSAGSVRIWTGYLWGLFYAAFVGIRLAGFAKSFPLHVLEPYLLIQNNWTDFLFILLGYFLVVSDIPFFDSLIFPTISRSGKRAWSTAMLWWIALRTACYLAVTVLGSMLVCIWHPIETGSTWSEIVRFIMRNLPEAAVGQYGLNPFPASLLAEYQPWEAFGFGILLQFGYAYMLALIMFAVNLRLRFGTILAVLVHFAGLLIIQDGQFLLLGISPIGNAMLTCHIGSVGLSLRYSVLFFVIACIVLICLVQRFALRCEYDIESSARVW